MDELGTLTTAVAKLDKKTDDMATQVGQIDKKIDVFIGRQEKTCELAGTMRRNHDITLYGDGSNPEHGLVGACSTMKERLTNVQSELRALKISCWGLAAAALIYMIGNVVSNQMKITPQSIKTAMESMVRK